MKGIKNELRSDWPICMKWHNMAEPAINDWIKKGTNENGLKCCITL